MKSNRDFENIEFSVADNVATIFLNRPDKGNAVSAGLVDELNQVANLCQSDPEIRAAVLTGKGKLFCGGGDLEVLSESGDDIENTLRELAGQANGAFSTFMRMGVPLIVAVNGPAAGIGLSLALLGDITIASEKASFTLAYTAAGLSPDGGASYLLPQAIGFKRAKELLITNRKLSAAEALDWGMVNMVSEPSNSLDDALKLAHRLAKGSNTSFAAVKSLMLSGFSESFETQMTLEAVAVGKNAAGVDGREGIAAFMEKRVPNFTS